jgi:hypothetical protein
MKINSNASVIAKEVQANSQSDTIAPHLVLQPTHDNPPMNELDELIKDRSEKVRLMKKDGDNSHKLLADLYGSPTHFITELLQNAEDEGANNVSFTLTDSELIFEHDAKKLFDFNDIRAISNFGDNQEKKEKPNAIGRFGIGFKSVYSITDNPRITSADFDITIRDYNIPERTNGQASEFFTGTKIILPFKAEIKEKTKQLLIKELKDLNLQYLLFLTNISSIKWTIGNESGLYDRISNKKDKKFVTLKSSSKEIKYILLEKPVQIDKKNLLIKIAFQLSTDRKTITACEKSPLFVFFPTKIETTLKFLVHAPFYTTPARENIQEGDNLINIEADHRNEELKLELGKLLVASLTTFKILKLLTVDLLNVLPIDKDNCKRSSIYKELFEAVKTELKSKKQLLPNSNGGLSSAEDLMLLGSADLADLLNSKQAKKIFGRSYWLSKKITINITRTLRDYLNSEIGIPEYDLTSFANKIDKPFFEEQTDKWLISFYAAIYKAPGLWKTGTRLLRAKHIVRIETKEGTKHVVPFQQNNKPNVFLPAKEHTKYSTVKLNIAKNKEAKKFLEELGLTPPDLFAEINEFIIPKLKLGKTYPDYFVDLKKIIEALQTANQEKRNRLIHDLRECSFILGCNIETGEMKLLKYYEVYFQTENLKAYFGSNPNAFFVAEEQYTNIIKEDKLRNLLSEIGVRKTLWRKQFTPNLTWEQKKAIRKNANMTYENYCHDYILDGLSEFLKEEINLEKSINLWQLLVKTVTLEQHNPSKFFQGEYSYKYYTDYKINFPAFFLKQLRETSWLVVENKNYRPNEISYSFLPAAYKANGGDLRILADVLEFKPDEIKAIEERFGGKFITGEKLKKFEQWESEQKKKAEEMNKKELEEDTGFSPEYKPEEADLNSRELEEADVTIKFNQQQAQSNNNEVGDIKENSEEDKNIDSNIDEELEEAIEKQNQKLIKDIGDWGQTYVSLYLDKEFENDTEIEIIDLNKKGTKGVGCDFVVKKNGEIIRLVEVKTTTEKFGQTLSISGTQWENARDYFRLNEGDKYWIYCVFNAGREDVEIVKVKNPIQKWKDGRLLAHPVNFVIK